MGNFAASGKTSRQMGVNLTLHGKRKDGLEFPIEASISKVEVAGKKYLTVILRDITLRIAAEQQEKKLNQELIGQNEQLQQFAYITSHNLRGPVASLMGLVNLIERENGLSDHNHTMIKGMDQMVRKLDGVIRDLNTILEFRNGLNAFREPIMLEQMKEEVSELLTQYLQEAGAIIETDFGRAAQVYSVRSYLHSIFYNLLSNAIKFRDPGRALKIRIWSWQEDDQLFISFSDNGLGMDLNRHRSNLFNLYKRFHLQIEGKGLGLHLVKTQVEALHGAISVESQEGSGSTFTVKLPA